MAGTDKSICIIGIGIFGTAIVDQLLKMRCNRISIIDSQENAVLHYKDTVDSTYIADAGSIRALKEIGIENFDIVIVAVSANTEIIACLMELGVQNIIARANGRRHARVLQQIGVKMIVSPEEESGIRTALIAANEKMLAYNEELSELGGDYVIGTVEVNNPLALDTKLSELSLDNVNVVFIRRDEEYFVPRGDSVLRRGDVIKIFGKLDDVIHKIKLFSLKNT